MLTSEAKQILIPVLIKFRQDFTDGKYGKSASLIRSVSIHINCTDGLIIIDPVTFASEEYHKIQKGHIAETLKYQTEDDLIHCRYLPSDAQFYDALPAMTEALKKAGIPKDILSEDVVYNF